jgi:hypothetical protein
MYYTYIIIIIIIIIINEYLKISMYVFYIKQSMATS